MTLRQAYSVLKSWGRKTSQVVLDTKKHSCGHLSHSYVHFPGGGTICSKCYQAGPRSKAENK